MPPVAGTNVPPPPGLGNSGTYGQQPGGNHHGDYYCWNRVYAQKNGVWTSTDPERRPWENLQDYVASNPINRSDPGGLFGGLFSKWAEHRNLTGRGLKLTNVPACLREQVMRGSQRIDWTHADVRAVHVDDTRMLGDTEAWLKAVRAAGKHVRDQNGKASCECLASLARIAGMGAHTIQDFYHHTDWSLNGVRLL